MVFYLCNDMVKILTAIDFLSKLKFSVVYRLESSTVLITESGIVKINLPCDGGPYDTEQAPEQALGAIYRELQRPDEGILSNIAQDFLQQTPHRQAQELLRVRLYFFSGLLPVLTLTFYSMKYSVIRHLATSAFWPF